MRTDPRKEYRAALIALHDAAYAALIASIKIGIKADIADIDDLRLMTRITDDFMDRIGENDE